MKNLFIDTASHNRIVAIVSNDKIIAFKTELSDNTTSSRMVPMLAEAFEEAKILPSEIDTIYVVTGPGSFTGIRVGLTIAKTYAWALNKKIVPISELEVISSGYYPYDTLVPYIDARRDYGYAGIYNVELDNLTNDLHILKDQLLEKIVNYPNIAFLSYDNIDVPYPVLEPNIDILKIIRKHTKDKGVNPHNCNPNYLKMTEAEEKLINHD